MTYLIIVKQCLKLEPRQNNLSRIYPTSASTPKDSQDHLRRARLPYNTSEEMGFNRTLLAGLTLFASAIAQTTAPVAFTSVPAVLVAGTSYNISWGGGDGSPVTLTLRKGDPSNLATIGVLADRLDGYSYNWQVSDSLQSATYGVLSTCIHANSVTDQCRDYALQITQGQGSINYSGQFTITGGSSNSLAAASPTSSSDSTITTSGTPLPTGAAGNGTGIGANATITRSGTLHTTSTVTLTLMRNSSETGQTVTTAPATSAHSTTRGAASTGSTQAPNSNAAVQYGGPAAFAVGIIGAVLLLN